MATANTTAVMNKVLDALTKMDSRLSALEGRPVEATVTEKPKSRRKAATKAKTTTKPKKQPKAAEPFELTKYVVRFSDGGGLLHHNGCRVFYRPEGDKKAQLEYLKAHGLDSKLYVALVMNDAYAEVWKTYKQAHA